MLIYCNFEGIPHLIPATPSEGQDIVPQELINHFVSMSDPRRDSAPDLAHHCAYNLPAVALTLGKDNWDLLKPAYETLAADRQVLLFSYSHIRFDLMNYSRNLIINVKFILGLAVDVVITLDFSKNIYLIY